MFRVKRNDQVVVLSGKDRGKKGKVLNIYPERQRATVEGLNLVKRHMRKSQNAPQGSIVSREGVIPLDRLLPVCPKCNAGVRVGFQKAADGTKNRVCKKCKEIF